MRDEDRRHERAMTTKLMDVFDAELVPGGYASREIPWWIAAQVWADDAGMRVERTSKLLPSEKETRARERVKADDAREAMGRKRRHKSKQVKDRIR